MNEGMIFFSHSRDNAEFVLDLAQRLRTAGANVWLDQLDIKPGTRWDSSIEKALMSSNTLIVVLSKASVQSNNVMDEVSYALEEGKRVVPLLLEECEIPFRLRRLQYADFTRNHEVGFQSLVNVLQLQQEAQPPIHQATPHTNTSTPTSKLQSSSAESTSPSQSTGNKRLLKILVPIVLVLAGAIWGIMKMSKDDPDIIEVVESKKVFELLKDEADALFKSGDFSNARSKYIQAHDSAKMSGIYSRELESKIMSCDSMMEELRKQTALNNEEQVPIAPPRTTPADNLKAKLNMQPAGWDALKSRTNLSPNVIFSGYPEAGIRGRYQILKNVLSKSILEKIVGQPAFVSGPHANGVNFNHPTQFGHYNPRFLKSLTGLLSSVYQDKTFVKGASALYDYQFKRYLRTYYYAYHKGTDDIYKNGFEFLEAYAVPTFWQRRKVDGTSRLFYDLLVMTMKTFDPTYLANFRNDPSNRN